MVQWDKDSCGDAGFLKIDLLGPGDALGGRALRGRDRARARRAHRPVAHPLRRPGGLRPHPGGGDDGRVPDRVARPDADAQAHAAGEPRRPHRAGGAGAARADPGRRGAPLHRAAQGAAGGPVATEVPYEHPSLEPVLRDTLGAIVFQDQVLEVAMAFAGFSAGRGRGPAPRDEPQALGGGHPRLRGEVRRRRDRARRRERGRPSGSGPRSSASRASASPRRTRPPSGCCLPVHLAARALPPGVPLRAAERAADGLLPARRAGARGAAARGWRCCRPAWRAAPSRVPGGGRGRGPDRARLRQRRARARSPRARGRARARAAPGARSATSPRARAPRRETLGKLAWAGACDALADGPARGPPAPGALAAGRGRAGRAGGRGHPAGAAARAARGPGAARAVGLGADAGRLRLDRRDAARAPAGADAPGPAGRPAHERASSSAVATAAACAWPAWSSPASARPPPRASRSCCSRTSAARST